MLKQSPEEAEQVLRAERLFGNRLMEFSAALALRRGQAFSRNLRWAIYGAGLSLLIQMEREGRVTFLNKTGGNRG